MKLLRYLDLFLLALALPVFIAADLPIIGYAVGGGAWLVQRFINAAFTAKAQATNDPRSIAGLMTGSMLARGWLVALAVFLVGLTQDQAGLAAAVLVIALFTTHFTMQMILRPFDNAGPAQ